MDKLFFFDTETTGNEEKDFLCEIGYKIGDKTAEGMFKPPIPVSVESMAVHHITNKMLADKPEFKYSPLFEEVKKYAHDGKTIFVAHNAQFDLRMLKKEGIIPERSICTLKVARELDSEDKIPSYRLQYLRYYLDLDVEGTAHDALGDVLVLEQLFGRLFQKMRESEESDEAVLEKMIAISARPSFIRKINFGKYSGRLVMDIAKTDPAYLEWLYKEKSKTPEAEEDWLYTLKTALSIE